MRVKRVFIVILIVALVVSCIFSMLYTFLYGKVEFKNITALCRDAAGNIYCVDESKTESLFYKIDREGKNVYTLKKNRVEGNLYYRFKNIVADDSGALYIHQAEINSGSQQVVSEKVLRVSPDGKQQSTVYQKEILNFVTSYSLDRFTLCNQKILFFEFDFQEDRRRKRADKIYFRSL